jgi:hypothetical protein
VAKTGRQTHAKRQREFAKREARRVKDERRAARKAAKATGVDATAPTLADAQTTENNSQIVDTNFAIDPSRGR